MIDRETVLEHLEYDPETGILIWKKLPNHLKAKIGKRAGKLCKSGYRSIGLLGGYYAEHRIVWLIMTGKMPSMKIDHRNRKRDDNRWGNLREVTDMENCQNRKALGVSWRKRANKWIAQIRYAGKNYHLGSFVTKEEAVEAYKAKKAELHTFAPEYQPA